MIKFLILVILFLIVFRFIARFLLPVFQVSRMAGDRLRQMQEQMENLNRQYDQTGQQRNNDKPTPQKGEFIDYEDVK